MKIAILWDNFKFPFFYGYIPGMTKDKTVVNYMYSFDLTPLTIWILLLIENILLF